MQIILARHGRPAWDFRTPIPGHALAEWLRGEAEAPLDSSPRPSAELERASKAATVLTGHAEARGAVVLVGHSLMNILIARQLRAAGWHGPRFPSPQHWTFGVYKQAAV